MLSHQLPVYSPLTLAAVARSLSGDDVRPALAAALRTDAWPQVTLTDSGTSALALALRESARIRDNLPCALPAYGCYDLASAAIAAGVRVRFYDIDPASLGPDQESLSDVLAGGSSAVVLVHPFGINVGSSSLTRSVHAASAILISDCAQADGLTIPPGEADFIVKSFGRGKGWTGGGGGALLASASMPIVQPLSCPSESVLAGARFAVKNGAQWLLGRPSLYALPSAIPSLGLGETAFKTPTHPQGLDPRSARLAIATVGSLERERALRRSNAIAYGALDLEGWGWRRPATVTDPSTGWLRYPILGIPRAIASREWRRLGIARGYPRALPDLPEARPIAEGSAQYPGAKEIAAQLWTLPTHSYVSEAWRNEIARWLQTHAPTSRP